MMSKTKALWAVPALALVLTGCSAINAGYVTNKVYEEANYTYYMQCYPSGKVTICNQVPMYDDADWRLDIKDGEDTGYVYVTEQTYNTTNVGDWISVE